MVDLNPTGLVSLLGEQSAQGRRPCADRHMLPLKMVAKVPVMLAIVQEHLGLKKAEKGNKNKNKNKQKILFLFISAGN